MKLKRTEITVEVDELIYAADRSSELRPAWCNACEALMTMVTPQQASAIAGVSVRTIYQWVESNRVHFVETGDGLLLLCVNSLGG